MKIRMPSSRAYYPASSNEPERLLCWIPAGELEELAAEGRVQPDILEDYPSGLEVPVSRAGFQEFGLDLGVDPAAIHTAYLHLLQSEVLPESGYVDGLRLEQMARLASPRGGDFAVDHIPLPRGETLPEPEWTDGEDPLTVMQKL